MAKTRVLVIEDSLTVRKRMLEVLAQLDSALAVISFANDLEVGIGGKHFHHALSDRQGILNHEHTCLRHGYPISVRMVFNKCPWSNSPLTM